MLNRLLSLLALFLLTGTTVHAQTVTGDRFRFTSGCVQRSGTGPPEAQVGSPCDTWSRVDSPYGVWLKTSGTGNTGWLLISAGGTVTSVALTTPTGLTVAGSPITTSGTFALSLQSGYMIPGGGMSGQVLRSQGASAPAWSTATYPATAGSAGSFIRSDGTNYGASTLVLPNAATATYIPYATATNTWGESANFTYDGTTLRVLSGSVRVNTSSSNAQLEVAASSGEVFRADAAAGAYRIVADQTGVRIGGPLSASSTIELGHASDTTLSRVSAGLLAVEGNTVAMLGTSNVFTSTTQTIDSSGDAIFVADRGGTGSVGRYTWMTAGATSWLMDIYDASGDLRIHNGTSAAVTFNRSTLATTFPGSMKIGTGSPSDKLDVDGTVRSTGSYIINASDAQTIVRNTGGGTSSIGIWSDGSSSWQLGAYPSGGIFNLYNNTAGTTPIEVRTNAPTNALFLDVSGLYSVARISAGTFIVAGTYVSAGSYVIGTTGLRTGTLGADVGMRIGTAGDSLITWDGGTVYPQGFRFQYGGTSSSALTIPATGNVDVNTLIGNPSFVSQVSNWRITAAGQADFRYIFADEMRIKLFSAEEQAVYRSSLMVTPSYGVLSAAFTCPAAGATSTLSVYDAATLPDARVFTSGNWVSIRVFTRTDTDVDGAQEVVVGDCVGQVTSYVDGSGVQSWTFTRGTGGSAGTLTAATVVPIDNLALDWGTTNNGAVELNAYDGAEGVNAPYIQTKKWTTAPVAANFSVTARLGKLTGITGTADEFGFLGGTYSASDGTYVKASNTGVDLHGVTQRWWDGATNVITIAPNSGAPYLGIGNPAPSTCCTSAGIFLGWTSGNVPAFSAYADANNYLTYNGSVLTWKAANTSLDASGNLTATSATLSGAVTATSGAIASWTLLGTKIKSGSGTSYVEFDSNETIAIAAGNETASSAPFRVTRAGAMTATSGNIASWVISGTKLSSGSGTTSYVGLDSNETIAIWAGDETAASAEFRVTRAGALTATSATITGTVTATAGVIGGWTLASNQLSSGSGENYVAMNSSAGTIRIWAGNATASSAEFQVTEAGAITATSGSIGGWQLATNRFSYDTGTAATSAGMAISDYPFYAGQTYSNRASAPFRVEIDGSLYATDATITSASNTITLDSNGITASNPSAIGAASAYKFSTGSIGGASFGLYAWEPGGGLTQRFLLSQNISTGSATIYNEMRADNTDTTTAYVFTMACKTSPHSSDWFPNTTTTCTGGTSYAGLIADTIFLTGTVSSMTASGTVRSNSGFNINGTAGMTRECSGTAGSLTFSGGILTTCTAVEDEVDRVAALEREVAELRAMVFALMGGKR